MLIMVVIATMKMEENVSHVKSPPQRSRRTIVSTFYPAFSLAWNVVTTAVPWRRDIQVSTRPSLARHNRGVQRSPDLAGLALLMITGRFRCFEGTVLARGVADVVWLVLYVCFQYIC